MHSYQVRQRSGLHLVHHLAALNFDRDLAGTQFCCDLFVEEPRDKKVSLACNKRTDTYGV
jgi:hypothetical protein